MNFLLIMYYINSSLLKYLESVLSELFCFNQDGVILLNGKPLKSADQFIYLGSNISSTKSNINLCISKVWTIIDRFMIIGKSDLSDKIKQNFFQVVAVSILLYKCTT